MPRGNKMTMKNRTQTLGKSSHFRIDIPYTGQKLFNFRRTFFVELCLWWTRNLNNNLHWGKRASFVNSEREGCEQWMIMTICVKFAKVQWWSSNHTHTPGRHVWETIKYQQTSWPGHICIHLVKGFAPPLGPTSSTSWFDFLAIWVVEIKTILWFLNQHTR